MAIIKLGGVYGAEIGKFIRDGDPGKQGILTNLPSLQERLGKSFGSLNDSGSAYANKGQYDRAIADFDEAIKLDPEYALSFYNRGCAYAMKGQHDRAIADYDEAIRSAIQAGTSDKGHARAATPNRTGRGNSFAEIFR